MAPQMSDHEPSHRVYPEAGKRAICPPFLRMAYPDAVLGTNVLRRPCGRLSTS